MVASDALHYYENFELRNPLPSILDVPQMLEGYDKIMPLAPDADHVVPGHDPAVMERYSDNSGHLPEGIFALHRDPRPQRRTSAGG